MTDQEQHHTIKKMEVVLEEVFENANDLPPDGNAREEKFPIPWYLRIFIDGGRGEIGNVKTRIADRRRFFASGTKI